MSAATYRRVIHNLIDVRSSDSEEVQGFSTSIYSHHIIELYEFTDNVSFVSNYKLSSNTFAYLVKGSAIMFGCFVESIRREFGFVFV